MSKFGLYAIVCVFILIAGCGTAPKGKGPVFSQSPSPHDMSTVIHYRIQRGCGSGAAYTLILNDEPITVIGNGGYYIQHLKPGTYEFKKLLQQHGGPFLLDKAIDNALAKAQPAYNLLTEPNRNYYLRWNACFEKNAIEEVSEEIALRQLEGLKAFEEIKLK